MVAYSNNHYFGVATRGTDMNANMWDQNWDCPPRPAEDLTPEELAELKALLSKGVETHNTIVLPFENYYVQQIYKGEDTYNTHDRCYQDGCDHVNNQTELGSGHMDKLVAYNPQEIFDWRAEDNWQGAWYTDDYEHINNFNSGTNTNSPGNCGCGESHFGTTLMTGMPTSGIDPEKQFGFHETWGTSHDYNNYIIVEYKGYYYVGFDYEAHKYDQSTHNHGEGLDIERDWNFTDWIVRITPAYHKGETPETPEVPGGGDEQEPDAPVVPTPTPNGDCIWCGHEHNAGSLCEECEEEGNECHGAESNIAPGTEDVEINLALDKKNDDLLESHLSMHVRTATDVEVFLPIPKQYYCEADDMAIVMQHDKEFVHGGPYQTVYQIGEHQVTLNVEYLDNGIRIWTEGITQEVIDYCRETYNDGITFEIWNYFNDPETGLPYISMDELKAYLDKATVKFLDKDPDIYVNSFGEEDDKYSDTNTGGNDFHVRPDDSFKDHFNDPTDGPYYNGSDKNEIYTKK